MKKFDEFTVSISNTDLGWPSKNTLFSAIRTDNIGHLNYPKKIRKRCRCDYHHKQFTHARSIMFFYTQIALKNFVINKEILTIYCPCFNCIIHFCKNTCFRILIS